METEYPANTSGSIEAEVEMSPRSALIKYLKDHDICIARFKRAISHYPRDDGTGPKVIWDNFSPPPGYSPDMDNINLREQPEQLSPAVMLSRSRPKRSRTLREREHISLSQQNRRFEIILNKNKDKENKYQNLSPESAALLLPKIDAGKINFFSKPLPTTSDEEEEENESHMVLFSQKLEAKYQNNSDVELETKRAKFEDKVPNITTPKLVKGNLSRRSSKNYKELRSSTCSTDNNNLAPRRLWETRYAASSTITGSSANFDWDENSEADDLLLSQLEIPEDPVKPTLSMCPNMSKQNLDQVELPESTIESKVLEKCTQSSSCFDDDDDDEFLGEMDWQTIEKLEEAELTKSQPS